MNILVSIIIPIYNSSSYLKECLDSILNQLLKDIEVFCINDGSTDNSLKILQQYALNDSRIKILKQNNQGAAAARNLGLSHANGKYVIFLDSDDYFEPDLIEQSVAKAEKFDADIVIFKAEAFDDVTGQTSALNDRITKLPEYQQNVFSYKNIPEDIFNSFLTAPWNKLYRKSFLDKHGFEDFKVSVKASDIFVAYQAYKLLSEKIDQPLHIGITESGGFRKGSVVSAIGLSWLLREGIGDTIRVSLAADPVEEVRVGFDILKALHLRSLGINFIACPTCSRTAYDVIGTLNALEKRLTDIRVPIDVAVMGCIVNGPGEAQHANIGICGGARESFYYENGQRIEKIPNEKLIDEVEKRIRAYVASYVAK